MTISIQRAIEFLKSIYQELEKQRATLKKNELYDASQFNPFRFFTTNEKGLSVVLAFLLNPNETHGQGDLLLNSFLKKLGLYSFLRYETVKVSLEKVAQGSMRRHDIFLQGFIGSNLVWVISIENKLRYANDQAEQVSDYLGDLQNYVVNDYCLIYLPPFARLPSAYSISSEQCQHEKSQNRLKIIDTYDLVSWLEDAPIVAPKIRQFTEFFIQFLKEVIMNETTANNALVEQILENDKNLDAALQIIAVEKQIRENLWGKLKIQLNDKFRYNYPILSTKGWIIDSIFKPSNRYMWLGIVYSVKESKNDEYYAGVAIEFNQSYYQECYYTAWVNKEKYQNPRREILIDKINKFKKENRGESTISRDFWKFFESDLKNWDATTWLRIQSGELANEIFERWQPILDIFEKTLEGV